MAGSFFGVSGGSEIPSGVVGLAGKEPSGPTHLDPCEFSLRNLTYARIY